MALPVQTVQRIDMGEIPSTQDEAKKHFATLSEGEWRVYTASSQTAGRGTHGRPWVSFQDKSILASYIFTFSNASQQIRYISQIAALAVSECLKSEGVKNSVKWVNDVLVNGKKVAGILTESELKAGSCFYLCIGIGVNVNVPAEAFKDQTVIDQPATSLMAETGREFSLDKMIASLSERLRENITTLEKKSYSVFREAITTNLETYGGAFITFDTECKEEGSEKKRYIKGVIIGVDEHGALMLNDEGGKCHIFSTGRIMKKNEG
ncbi:MAG: biotin--[acetyl-CoA-carboxylase] ligase [Halobacteriovoraceae bacterium]|nr:biotin--[acetyl-CoA-carboxylase] ligase [Halobacteriovoraceae bacterium]